ncbi:MAG: shikimate kinase [Nitrospinae bacterium]|nr:shikimate kinase [Nitrospinota bacterium]
MHFDKIVLIGFKGSGKTKVGKLLSSATGWKFLDIDAVVENMHAEAGHERERARGIFYKFGGDYFRCLEGKAIEQVSKVKYEVVSLGGGTPMNQRFKKEEFGNAAFVHLDGRPDVIFERIMRKGIPPFFDKENPRKSFDALYAEREPHYKRLANFTVDNSGIPAEQACGMICKLLGLDAEVQK